MLNSHCSQGHEKKLAVSSLIGCALYISGLVWKPSIDLITSEIPPTVFPKCVFFLLFSCYHMKKMANTLSDYSKVMECRFSVFILLLSLFFSSFS